MLIRMYTFIRIYIYTSICVFISHINKFFGDSQALKLVLLFFFLLSILNFRLSSRSILGENNKLLASVKYNQSLEYHDENKMTVYREIRSCPDSYLYPSIRLSCSNFGEYRCKRYTFKCFTVVMKTAGLKYIYL